MNLSETDRNRLRLWRRWNITFDWFSYTPPMQRVHQALLVHQHPWTTRKLATYTNLPQTTVRRQLDLLGPHHVEKTEDGFQISELGMAFAASFHRDIVKYVRGGRHLNRELVELIRQAPDTEHMNFEMLENHVWWPIIEGPVIDDA